MELEDSTVSYVSGIPEKPLIDSMISNLFYWMVDLLTAARAGDTASKCGLG